MYKCTINRKSISEENSGSSISEEDSGSVKCELSDYVSTYTFCRSVGMQMVSLQYEFAHVASALTVSDISSHRNHKYDSHFAITLGTQKNHIKETVPLNTQTNVKSNV